MSHHSRFKAITTDASNSSFSRDILEYEFSKKFMILTFNFYSSQSDSVQHLRQYQDKMVIHFRNNFILCWIFPSSLKGVAFDWFYSLPPCSIYGFEDLTKLFLAQYFSHQVFKQNNHNLLSRSSPPTTSRNTLDAFRIR